jgi:hypothetical protein
VGTMETTRGTRRPAVLAVVAVVALAALVLVAVGRDGGPPVIRLGAAGAGAQTTMEAASDDLTGIRLAGIEYRFELTDGARFPAGEARAYRLEPPADLEAATRDLADRLGLAGEVTASPWGDGGRQVGATDGSGPSLWVDPAGNWSYNDPTSLPEVRCVDAGPVQPLPLPVEPDEGVGDGAGEPAARDDEPADEPTVEADAGDGEGVRGDLGSAAERELVDPEPCELPPPPAGVPDATEAHAAADRFFASLDLPGTPRNTEAVSDDWSAWVSAQLVLDGRDSDLHVSVSFGPDAVVTSASATLAELVEVDRYPTVDAEAAVARLEAQQGGAAGVLPLVGRAATDTAGPVDPDTPVDAPAEHVEDLAEPSDRPVPEPGVLEDEELTILPAPDEPVGEPEVVTVTLVDAEPIAMLTFDVDGTVWLLPGVRFRDDDGGEWQVLTVADEYLDTDAPATEPGQPEPAPLPEPEPGTGGEEPGEPGTLPVDPGPEPGTDPGLEPEPVPGDGPGAPDQPDTAEAEKLAHDVVGRSEEEAVAAIERAGLVARTVARDGESFAVTDDYRTDRINLTVEAGTVVEAHVG